MRLRPSNEAMRRNLDAERRAMAGRGYVTAREAASLTGESLATIYRWLRQGRIDGMTCGTFQRRWVSVARLGQFMASVAVPGRDGGPSA